MQLSAGKKVKANKLKTKTSKSKQKLRQLQTEKFAVCAIPK